MAVIAHVIVRHEKLTGKCAVVKEAADALGNIVEQAKLIAEVLGLCHFAGNAMTNWDDKNKLPTAVGAAGGMLLTRLWQISFCGVSCPSPDPCAGT